MVAGNIFYVPWPDFSEWNTVREQIFSSRVQDTITAYRTIMMWKLKYDSIPAYIECTYSLLQVMVKEYEMTKNEQNSLLFDEHDLQLSYSTALIRFVNHISSIGSYKGETLYLAAKTQNIPDWIINMRHDVAHGQDLPGLDALHVAAELSLKWLLDNYWGNSEILVQRSVDEPQIDIESGSLREIDTDVQNLFRKFFDIWELCKDAKYKNKQYVIESSREFILHNEEMLSLYTVYFNNLENDAVLEIQNIVNAYNQMEENGEVEPTNSCRFMEFKMLLLKFLKNIIKGREHLKETLVMSLLETSFLSETSFSPKKWQPILCLLQETGSFSFLLEILFQMAGKGNRAASKWLSIFSPSIKHLKKQWAIFKVLRKERNNYKTKLLKKKVQTNCKPTDPDFVISLGIFKPPVISLDMMRDVLLSPEQFSVKDIVEYLKMVKPPLMKFTIDMIRDLVSLHLVGNKEKEEEKVDEEEEEEEEEEKQVTEEKVFTVDDLDKMMEVEGNLVFEEGASGSDGWIRSSIDVNAWNKCPLGLLPFQKKVECSLPESLSWEKKRSTRKRVAIPLLKHSVSMKKLKEI